MHGFKRGCALVLISILVATLSFAGGIQDTAATTTVSEQKATLGVSPFTSEGRWATLQEYEAATGKKITSFGEAPMLQKLVAEGKLPPVEDRISNEPLVISPLETIGKYGGELVGIMQSKEFWGPQSYMNEESLLARDLLDVTKIHPNIVKAFEFSEDAKTLTFYLREGAKWSDGAPFTVDDFIFWYDDFLHNKELSPTIPSRWQPGGETIKMTVIDDYTVRYEMATPWPGILFMYSSKQGGSQDQTFHPSHYMKQFHIKYNPDADKLAKEAGFDFWYQLYNNKRTYNDDTMAEGLPVLSPWVPEVVALDHVTLVRNPYYWKIDTEGNQLPYIDVSKGVLAGNPELVAAKVISGVPDIGAGVYGGSITLDKYPVFMQNAEKNNYKVSIASPPEAWAAYEAGLLFNHNYPDEEIQVLLNTPKFKQALSIAINREEINQLVFYDLGKPTNAIVVPSHPFWEPRFAEANIQFDPETAKKMLDELGLKTDSEGFRLRSDGKRLELVITIAPVVGAHAGSAELVADQWGKIGIKTIVDVTGGWEMWGLFDANKTMMEVWQGDGTDYASNMSSAPWWGTFQFWAAEWKAWDRSGGEAGTEPPATEQEFVNIWRELPYVVSESERLKMGRRAMELHSENLWIIPLVAPPPPVKFARKNLMNIDLNRMRKLNHAYSGAFQWYFE